MRGFVPDFVQLANENGNYTGRILAVQRESDYRATAASGQNALYTLIHRGLENGRTGGNQENHRFRQPGAGCRSRVGES